MTKPKIAALITASGGIGSHLILHKMQGHPDICTLKESAFRSMGGTTKGHLKKYLSQGEWPYKMSQEQLLPKKHMRSSEWMVLNKPPLKMVNYHRTFHPELPVLYIFRNPVALYYTWVKKWKEYGERRYGRVVSDEVVFEWFKSTYMSSLFELAQVFNPKTDHIISFEHFVADIDSGLERIFKCLDVPVIKNEDLKTLDVCATCGTEKITRKKITVRGERVEEVLHCERHGPSLGPGEYNYIRKEDSSFLNKWKNKDDVIEVSKRFSKIFGLDFISYYADERYTTDTDRSEFDSLMNNFLTGLKIEV